MGFLSIYIPNGQWLKQIIYGQDSAFINSKEPLGS